MSVPPPDSKANSGRAEVPGSTVPLTIVVCADGANTVSPPVGVMLAWRLPSGRLPSTSAGTETLNCALVWPAAMVTDPLGSVPPKALSPR